VENKNIAVPDINRWIDVFDFTVFHVQRGIPKIKPVVCGYFLRKFVELFQGQGFFIDFFRHIGLLYIKLSKNNLYEMGGIFPHVPAGSRDPLSGISACTQQANRQAG
jgi:hypothetical protein